MECLRKDDGWDRSFENIKFWGCCADHPIEAKDGEFPVVVWKYTRAAIEERRLVQLEPNSKQVCFLFPSPV
jgi:hypothetical protein